MHATMAMVYEGLQSCYPCSRRGAYDPAAHVAFATCNGSGSRRITVVQGCGPVDASPRLLVRVCPPGTAMPDDCALCVYSQDGSADIARAIELVLSHCRQRIDALYDAALSGLEIDDLVEIAHETIQNPLIVLDRVLRVKASTRDDVMDDDMWRPLDAHMGMFSHSAEPPGFADFISKLERDKTVYRFEMFNGRIVSSCRTREMDGDYLFVCLVEKNRPVSESDIAWLEILCRAIEVQVESRETAAAETIGLDGLLADALDGVITTRVELENRLRVLGIELLPYARVLVVVPQRGHLSSRQAQRVLEDMTSAFHFDWGLEHAGRLVFVSMYESEKAASALDSERLHAYLKRHHLRAGYGVLSDEDSPLLEAYQTAICSLSIGRKLSADKALFFFDDLRGYYLYEVCAEAGNPALFVHPAFDTLTLHDAEARVPLAPVLETLALNWGNRSKTAKELFIQRNTLQARINDIETICGIDLSDQQLVKHIRHSYLLQQYCRKDTRGGEES